MPDTLRSASIGHLEYRLYAPKALLNPKERLLRPERLLTQLPVAGLDGGGEYMEGVEAIAQKAGGHLNQLLACTTLPQVCRAVQGGGFIGVLPIQAGAELPDDEFAELSFPSLKSLRRPLALAWNPRLDRVRDGAGRVQKALVQTLHG